MVRPSCGARAAEQVSPVTVVIDGRAVAKGRARMTRRGITYTPAATRKYEAHGRLAAQIAMDGRPPITLPVRVELLVVLPIPRSWSKSQACRRDGRRPAPVLTA